LISWKYSFEKIGKDLELARKKKQALNDLFNSGKISASTYESLDKELTGIISEIEARQKDLADKMTSKIADLENQIGTLEMFLANSEIQYVAGEIDDELHASESSAFSSGLEAVKKQLVAIKEVVTSLMPEVVAPPPLSTPSETEETQITEEAAGEITEVPVESPVEASIEETLVEEPVEEAIGVEPVSEEVMVEAPLETSTEEMSTAEVAEVTTEEVAEIPSTEETVEKLSVTLVGETLVEEEAPSTEVFEEPVITEFPAEKVTEETVTAEEVVVEEEAVIKGEDEASTEESSSYEEEEETTEEVYESY